MALYAGGGFQAHPAMVAVGRLPAAGFGRRPTGVEPAGVDQLEVVAAIDRQVRGAARTVDLAYLLGEPGNRLLLDGDRGYVVGMDDRVVTLVARDEASASRLLRAALADAPPGGLFELNWLSGASQWAVPIAMKARLELRAHGTLMTRPAPPLPGYIPSGGYG